MIGRSRGAGTMSEDAERQAATEAEEEDEEATMREATPLLITRKRERASQEGAGVQLRRVAR
jgi:hypothetical protein